MLIKDIDDYLDEMHRKYPKLSKEEIKKTLQHGFLTFYALTRKGADMVVGNQWVTAYCGKRFADSKLGAKYVSMKHKIKLRAKYKFDEEIFKGEYYFGLTDGQWEDYKNYMLASKKQRRKKFKFTDIVLYKIKEECFLSKSKRHFFVFYYPVDRGWSFVKNEIATTHYDYLGYRGPDGKIVYI